MRILSVVTVSVILVFAVGCNMGGGGFKTTKSGIKYKIYTRDNSDTTRIRVGSIVTMDIDYGKKDSTIFNSRTLPDQPRFPIPESQYEGDLYEALKLFKQGDSATFIIKSEPFFTQTVGQPEVPPFMKGVEDLYFNVKIVKVQTQAEATAEEQQMLEKLKEQEIGDIANYIATNNITVEPDTNGIYYIETKTGTGKKVKDGEYATVHFEVYKLNGDKVFSTYERGEPLDFKFGSRFENKGFQEVVSRMREGGKAEALVPSDMAFGAQGAGNVIDPYSPIYYHIELLKVMNQEQYDKKRADQEAKKLSEQLKKDKEEEATIKKYLADNNITPTEILPSGLVYIETEKGTGPKPVEGQKVKVNYTGKLLDGTVFDSSYDRGEPLEFPLGKRAVIEGWDKGVALMNEGGKATLIIPSKLAYKDKGAGDKIPPYATLVFDVELVSVEQE